VETDFDVAVRDIPRLPECFARNMEERTGARRAQLDRGVLRVGRLHSVDLKAVDVISRRKRPGGRSPNAVLSLGHRQLIAALEPVTQQEHLVGLGSPHAKGHSTIVVNFRRKRGSAAAADEQCETQEEQDGSR
jgi:hypothetical protein